MITIYNYLTEANFKDVVSKMEEKGYPIINPELPAVFIFSKGKGDIFLKSGYNIYNKKFESVYTTRAHEKELGVTLPSGDKKFEQFLVDKEPIAPLMGTDFASTKKGLWSVEKEVIPNNNEDTDFSPQHYEEELLVNSQGMTAFEALKEGLSYILGDFSQDQLDDLPFLANELDLNFEVKHVFIQDWGTTITTIRKTDKFRLRNKYHDWFKPFLIDSNGNEVSFDFSYRYADTVEELSKLLSVSVKVIKKMMGLYGSQNWYLYSDIYDQGDRLKASKTIDFISACMLEENVNPFLIDELDADFFSNQNRGENLIVNTSNFYDSNRRQMPAFIGTTNASDYSMNERGKSRTYYLKIDRVFDGKLEEHSLGAFKSLLDEIDDKLFQDFIVRFSNKLSDDSLNWAVYSSNSNTGSVDFLYHAREIFKEYFQIAGIRLPEWFPLLRYDDKKETDRELWRKQYEYHKEKFKLSSDGTVYLFNLKGLDEYEISGRYSKERKPSDFYRQSMPQEHLVTTSGTDIIEIKVDSFHKWIGVDKPKIGLFKKLFSKK